MGSVTENRKHWSCYDWSGGGDEWSAAWGGTEYLWSGTIFPRIRAFVPTGTILEIAPGYGRCTGYLKDLCDRLIVVDLAENCVRACKRRFASSSHIEYVVNDGKSLDMIEDESIDFVFSWDSLVHAERDVLLSYLEHLAIKLKPGSWGFIHHSNIGSFFDAETGKLTIENRHWRAESMTADLFEEFCRTTGLACVSQELVNWGCADLTDCLSLFTRNDTSDSSPAGRVENPGFMEEAASLRRISSPYGRNSQSDKEIVPRHRRALLLQSEGKTEEAVQELKDLLVVDKSNAQAHNDIAVLYFELGDQDKAIQHLQESVGLDPDNIDVLKNLASVYLTLGRTQEAVSTYQNVLSLNPGDADALLSLGDLCGTIGQDERAALFYRKILETDPDNALARQRLENLPPCARAGGESATDRKVTVSRIRSYKDYREHAHDMRSEYADRRRYERSLITDSEPFTVRGSCYICKREVEFWVDYESSYEVDGVLAPNWRERMACPSCGLINRMRASIHLFEQLFQPGKETNMYVAEQTTPVYRWFAKNYSNVVGSEYLGKTVPLGEADANGVRNESITDLSFADGEIDFVLTFDVFEHIADFQKAFKECYRVLKPTGALFFTVPFRVDAERNAVCAAVKDTNEIEHFLPPEYHGPWLVFNQFGWEMLDELRSVGFQDVTAHLFWSKELGYLGREQTVFVAKKEDVERSSYVAPFTRDESASRDSVRSLREGEPGLSRPSLKRKSASRNVKKKKPLICLSPFYWMNSFYEDVYCCCPGWTKVAIGNIRQSTIAEIWNSEEARYIRRKMYQGEWEEICNPICPKIAAYRHQNKTIEYDELEKSDLLTPKLIEEIRARKDRLESFPTLFKPDNSNVCNLSCIMCDRQIHKDDPELIEKTARDMRNYLPSAKAIVLSGIGDPLAIPYARDLLANYEVDGSELRFDLITNGLLLPKYWDKIKHQRFGGIQVSVDAATRPTYESIRVGGTWEALLHSLALLQENRDKFNSVGITMVVMRANYSEIPSFIDLAESYGFGVSFQKITGTYGDQNIFEMRDSDAIRELQSIIAGERTKKRTVGVCWNNLVDLM